MKENSERVPGKNIKHIAGKPLFFYIADTLRDSDLFDVLAINTDSDEINTLALQRYGEWVQLIQRPLELCGNHVPMNSIIAHDVSLLGFENDYFQTHSTNPLLSKETIKNAVSQYKDRISSGLFDSVFSVNELYTRLYDKNLKPINHNPQELLRTQDLEVVYEENSNFYVFSGKRFSQNHHRIGINPSPYLMNRNSLEGIDIDEPSDWDFAEAIIASRNKDA